MGLLRTAGAFRSLLPMIFTAAAVVMLAPLGASAQPAVPNPTVSGPIPSRVEPGHASHDYPWMTTMHNLAGAGYVEEEFFYEGTARRFNTTGENARNGTLRDGGHRYRTRMLVRRPANMRRFNGVVLAEWQNVTAGYDLDAMWGGSFEHIVRAGYVWVGISAQRVGVQGEPNGLKLWSPTRYGSLDVTAGGTVTDDSLSYDIFAQGVQAIRNPMGVNVLGGAVPKTIIAMGASQSAGRLGTFINALHGQLGGPIDAYFLMIGGGRVREDLAVPVFKLLSETDVPGQVNNRQPDTDRFRHWEVAGTSHSSRRTSMNAGPMTRRDSVSRAAAVCEYPTYPRVPMNYVLSAVYDHMTRWVQDKVPPPIAPRVEVQGSVIQRDERGNALGGIRLAEFDPPTALNSGANTGSGFCRLYGRYEPFPDEVVNGLYPNKRAYTSRADAITAQNLRLGYILAPDARESRTRASQSIAGLNTACAEACHAAQDLLDASYFYLGLSSREKALTGRLAAIIRTIATADAAGGGAETRGMAKARRDLEGWLRELQAMERNGALTALTVEELTSMAQPVLRALPGA